MWIALKFNVLLMGRSSNEELMKELSDQRRGGGGEGLYLRMIKQLVVMDWMVGKENAACKVN